MIKSKMIRSPFKKVIAGFIAAIFCFHTLKAEAASNTAPITVGNKTTLGIKVGYGQSSFYGSDLGLLSSNAASYPFDSYQIGLVANTAIGKYFWLKHELNFQQSGARILLTNGNNTYKVPLKMHMIQLLPLSPAFHIKGLQLYGGPYLSVLTGASILRKDSHGNDYKDKSIFGNGKEEGEHQKYLQKFDFGIGMGLEYSFNFGLNLGARYTYGTTPIFDNANANTFEEKKSTIAIYNQAWNFYIGYTF